MGGGPNDDPAAEASEDLDFFFFFFFFLVDDDATEAPDECNILRPILAAAVFFKTRKVYQSHKMNSVWGVLVVDL